ncbi:hypothetical protein CBS14141_002266 [Malassezia furfur]|nr:hypothetical protein CBS14141_002266 [Malassezia furfur]
MLLPRVAVRRFATGPARAPRAAPPPKQRAAKHAAPPRNVVNFRNMQRRRGGDFRTDIRVASKRPPSPSLREHLFRTSHEMAELARGGVPEKAFHEAHARLQTRMDEWRRLARNIRTQDTTAEHIHPQLAAAAWNQVIDLAVRAGMPSAAWRVYCEMKRAHVRPTARTYAGYFAALATAVRAQRIDVATSSAWLAHIPKLYAGLEQLHHQAAQAAPATPTDDTAWLGTPTEDATGARGRPSVVASKSRVLHELHKDPHAIVAAYSAYISLLCALGRPDDALQVWNDVCPDPYPGRRTTQSTPHLPRSLFATAPTYTALMRDLGRCRMPLAAKQAAIRDIWARWQFDLLATTRTEPHAAPLLDATAVKTLVWTLAIGSPRDAVQTISALLGTYCGVAFTHTPKAIHYSVPSTWHPVPIATPKMLVDILAFYDKHGQYTRVLDCYEHAERTQHTPGAVRPEAVPEAVAYVDQARKHIATQTP